MALGQHEELRHRRVGEVVAEDFRRASAFKRFGIDFCCGGGRTVEAACEAAGVDYSALERELVSATLPRSGPDSDVRSWSPVLLANHIVDVHHLYVRDTLPVLREFAVKVAKVHGGERPELDEIRDLVEELADAMEIHMREEEDVVFPYIQELAREDRAGEAADGPAVRRESSADLLRAMEEDHAHAGESMARIRELTEGFTPPDWACNTYRALFAKLEEFEEDLHRHVHLENHVLFPMAERLEREPV